MEISEKLCPAWVLATYEDKRRPQKLIFPQGVLYNKQNGKVRTEMVNSLFAAIGPLARISGEKETGDLYKDRLIATFVPGTGIEPAHHC